MPCFSSFFFLCPTVVEVVVIVVDVLETDLLRNSCICPVSVDNVGLYCSHHPLLSLLLSNDCEYTLVDNTCNSISCDIQFTILLV